MKFLKKILKGLPTLFISLLALFGIYKGISAVTDYVSELKTDEPTVEVQDENKEDAGDVEAGDEVENGDETDA